jgi:hypothetical protein
MPNTVPLSLDWSQSMVELSLERRMHEADVGSQPSPIPIWRPHIVVNTARVVAVHTGRTHGDSIRYERYLTVIER